MIAMEACGSSNYWGREIAKLGHEVRLINPQYVKPYIKRNKNDYIDAEAICEAASRPNIRFVSVKRVAQQDGQSLYRVRQSTIKAHTALVTQIRGLLGEYGLVIAQRGAWVRRRVPEILEDAENGLTDLFRRWLSDLYEDLRRLDERVKDYDRKIQLLFHEHEDSQRLVPMEEVGIQTATVVVSSYGQAKEFKNDRRFAASVGLVPRQHTTGGKPRLLGISMRGDRYIRTLLIHGARAVVRTVERKQDARSRWIQWLIKERGMNRAVGGGSGQQKCSDHIGVVVTPGELPSSRVVTQPDQGLAFTPFAHRLCAEPKRHSPVDKAWKSQRGKTRRPVSEQAMFRNIGGVDTVTIAKAQLS